MEISPFDFLKSLVHQYRFGNTHLALSYTSHFLTYTNPVYTDYRSKIGIGLFSINNTNKPPSHAHTHRSSSTQHTNTATHSNLPNTLCPNCHTRFSIRSAQLHAQQGLVRCGLCLHIFNALTAPSHITPVSESHFSKTNIDRLRTLRWLTYLLILSLTLILALTLFFRNTLIKHFPTSATIFQPMCRILLCSLSPAHNIDALSIAHSELLRGQDPDTYILRIILQNRANYTVKLPTVEISLINSQGKLILRRILGARDYLSIQNSALAQKGLKENTNLSLEIVLRSQETATSYQLFSFYP